MQQMMKRSLSPGSTATGSPRKRNEQTESYRCCSISCVNAATRGSEGEEHKGTSRKGQLMRHHNEVMGQPQGRMACVLKKVRTIEHQYKDLILRSLTFGWDDIEMEGRS